jgi:hypothetical protein
MVNFFSNYMNKKLTFFEFYGYYEIIINISKNINILFIGDAQAIHFVYKHFDTWQIDGYISKIDT